MSSPNTETSPKVKALRIGLALLTAGFVAAAVWRLIARWDAQPVSISWPLVALSCMPMFAYNVGLGCGWTTLLRRMTNVKAPLWPLIAIHASSNLGRYTPGKVALPLLRISGAAKHGVPAAAVGASVMIDVLSWAATGAVVALVLIIVSPALQDFAGIPLSAWSIPLLGLAVVGTLVLIVVDRRRYPAALIRLLKVEGEGPLLPRVLPLIHLVVWLFWLLHGLALSLAA